MDSEKCIKNAKPDTAEKRKISNGLKEIAKQYDNKLMAYSDPIGKIKSGVLTFEK